MKRAASPHAGDDDVLTCVPYRCRTAVPQGALILKILRGKYPAVSGYSPDISDVIKRCLTQVRALLCCFVFAGRGDGTG